MGNTQEITAIKTASYLLMQTLKTTTVPHGSPLQSLNKQMIERLE